MNSLFSNDGWWRRRFDSILPCIPRPAMDEAIEDLPAGCEVKFIGEGAANAVFKIDLPPTDRSNQRLSFQGTDPPFFFFSFPTNPSKRKKEQAEEEGRTKKEKEKKKKGPLFRVSTYRPQVIGCRGVEHESLIGSPNREASASAKGRHQGVPPPRSPRVLGESRQASLQQR